MSEIQNSNWIWIDDWKEESKPVMVLFRKEVFIDNNIISAQVKISADSRYKLYINNRFVQFGPSKGDQQVWYFDQIDLLPYLKKGKNVIAVQVLRYPMKPSIGNQSIVGTFWPGLFFTADIEDEKGHVYDISADETWKCNIDDSINIGAESKGFSPLCIYEQVKHTGNSWKWTEEEYDTSDWNHAKLYLKSDMRDAISPANLKVRTIPFLFRKNRKIERVIKIESSLYNENIWEDMLLRNKPIVIPANTEEIVELDAGEEMIGYLRLLFKGGKGAQIFIQQAESYVLNEKSQIGQSLKCDRTDVLHGHLEGNTDSCLVAGNGTDSNPEKYEPFWYRTFRFIRMRIVTDQEPLTILSFDYEETGYPLNIQSHVTTTDVSLEKIWDISARTLQRCMLETYVDCPFYEQLQYIMDTRAQILYTYASAADDRLARKAMDDFKRAQRYDGLMYSAYPNTRPNIIPGFSIFYIMMIHDHMMYFGDKELVKFYMPNVMNILNFYERSIDERGLVGKVGGLFRKDKCWSFIDWVPKWSVGVPTAAEKGPITMESLLYIKGLQCAEELAQFLGWAEQAAEYHSTGENVKTAVQRYCTGSNGMIQDGPGVEEYSQHCQVFAILTETIDQKSGKKNLEETILYKEQYAQCTISMALYLFEALRRTGLYAYTDDYWNIWRTMIHHQLTTCAESNPDEFARSDCHAWGALALYELPAVTLGVRPVKPGFAEVCIQPEPGYMTEAEGEVITPKGFVKVHWKKNEENVMLNYSVPEGMKVQGQEE